MLYIPSLPQDAPKFEDYQVSLNGQKAELHAARVSAMPYNTVWPGCQRPLDQTEMAPFLSFEADEPVEFQVVWDKEPEEVVIRPLSAGVIPRVNGKVISFILPGSGQYTVEADGFHRALHIFANPVNDFCVKADDPNVLYYGPGIHHPGRVLLKSHQTVYIDREAVVYGAFSALGQEDVRICGYGIIDGSFEHRVTGHTFYLTDFDRTLPDQDEAGLLAFLYKQNALWGNVRFLNCQNVRLEGVILRDSASFSVIPAGCENVLIDNVKTIGMWRYNSDGIDIINSRNCVICNCFLRDFDDCVVIKGVMGWDTLNNENILVQNCVVWCDWGRALEIGAETCAPEYRNITFQDCDVIHGSSINLDIQHHNQAEIHHIIFDDIRVEYNRHQLPDVYQHDMTKPYAVPENYNHPDPFGVYMCKTGFFCTDYRNGCAHDILFRNIQILTDGQVTPPPTPKFLGISPENNVQDIVIENLTIDGVKAEMPEEAHIITNDFADRIIIR